ncbi:hypothetical protein PIB30_044948 [Stylosanthes scabra]|uniref:Uncharacterized protein n=1 Tax=Stylosanthes scabra TaxID=79078 RepID=A0ABU6RGK5_9FABA|nr:hypothetical protein [Stylosanthes scabra]
MEGRLKFDDSKPEMRVDTDPFEVNSSFAEPEFLGVNMVGFHSYEFDTALGDFETNVRQVFHGVGEGLLDFMMQQKLKDRDVSMWPHCNAVFNVEAAEIFEKGNMKKELARREVHVRQNNVARRPTRSFIATVALSSENVRPMKLVNKQEEMLLGEGLAVLAVALEGTIIEAKEGAIEQTKAGLARGYLQVQDPLGPLLWTNLLSQLKEKQRPNT